MLLLNTKTIELEVFYNMKGIPPSGYATFSHIWEDGEPSFCVPLQFRHGVHPDAPEKNLFDAPAKILEVCRLARNEGITWIWIDLCCIDVDYPHHLHEAVTSIYQIYARARKCYVYLADVPTETAFVGDRPQNTPFHKSEWHKRGWTLPELVASP